MLIKINNAGWLQLPCIMKTSLTQVLFVTRDRKSTNDRIRFLKQSNRFVTGLRIERGSIVPPVVRQVCLGNDIPTIGLFFDKMKAHPERGLFDQSPKVIVFASVVWQQARMRIDKPLLWHRQQWPANNLGPPGQNPDVRINTEVFDLVPELLG